MERINQTVYLFLILFSSLLCVEGKTISPAESGALNRFLGFYEAIKNAEGQAPESWSDIERYDKRLEGFGGYFPDGQNIDDVYSFISEEDRSKFPDGELLLIRSVPRDWPEVWKYTPPDIDPTELTEDQKAEIERLKDRERPIRYLIYRNENGDLESIWWFEEDVQKMLAETGIRIPEPQPYQPPSVVKIPPAPPVQEVAETIEKVTASETTSEEPSEVAIVQPIEEDVEQSSNWWLWLIGAVVVVAGIGLAVRRKS